MGEEIEDWRFEPGDFTEFERRLNAETERLASLVASGAMSMRRNVAGLELEAWLVDEHARPLPINERFLERLSDPMVVPELSAFNVELNVAPQPLTANAIRVLRQELVTTWHACRDAARALGADVVAIGVLPTVRDGDLTLEHMSDTARYRALNEQILKSRGGKPLELVVQGRQHIDTVHRDVMLEAATTSLQLHLQVGADEAARVHDAAVMASAPVVAVAANSPYAFEHDLWDETRIPLFEQAIGAGAESVRRVTFGERYAGDSLVGCFTDNVEKFDVLLPSLRDDPPERLSHLRLHNGTIWRWNRPLIGFDDDGTPHFRIEHRVIPAGPTVVDAFANAAFFWGLTRALADGEHSVPPAIPFEAARRNFYEAARYGLSCSIEWLDRDMHRIRDVIIDHCVPLAASGLRSLAVDPDDVDFYLGIVAARAASGQNGAAWQREWVRVHGLDFPELTQQYMHRQNSEIPVHEWDV